tara:strand:- start:371 stop:499 length:129 start_codon:yes stop_codon:yes gene_type:complete
MPRTSNEPIKNGDGISVGIDRYSGLAILMKDRKRLLVREWLS